MVWAKINRNSFYLFSNINYSTLPATLSSHSPPIFPTAHPSPPHIPSTPIHLSFPHLPISPHQSTCLLTHLPPTLHPFHLPCSHISSPSHTNNLFLFSPSPPIHLPFSFSSPPHPALTPILCLSFTSYLPIPNLYILHLTSSPHLPGIPSIFLSFPPLTLIHSYPTLEIVQYLSGED